MKTKVLEVTNEYALYLMDESKRKGFAEKISFPESTEAVAEVVRYADIEGLKLTVQGSRTGVGGGAVPEGGLVISLEKLRGCERLDRRQSGENRLDSCDDKTDSGETLFKFGAGMRLNEIDGILKKAEGGPYFLPPDPTETTASIGGAASCNSSGARTYGYGPVRSFIEGLTVVMSDGSVLNLMRGDFSAEGRTIDVPGFGRAELPSYTMPDVKNAAGYYIKDGVDLVDLFIGSEGTLGIITEVVVRPVKKPSQIWGLIAFLEEEDGGLDCTDMLREEFPPLSADLGLISMEFFDCGSLELLRMGGTNLPDSAKEAVFLEICGDTVGDIINIIRRIEFCIERAGGNPSDAFVAGGERMFREFKEVRHRTPVMVNEIISSIKKTVPSVTKLGSDMAVPASIFRRTAEMYRTGLEAEGLDYVIFGHVGNCHLHCNILSRNEDEYRRGKELFAVWAGKVSSSGGSVSAEHGVGKIKKDFLLKMYGEEGVGEMKRLKNFLDPKGILGRGNIF